MATVSPISMLASMGPAERVRVSANPSRRMRVMASGLIASSSNRLRVAQHQSANNQKPPVNQNKQQKLERQGDHRGGKHLHPHRKQNVGDYHVHDNEGHKDQKPYLERFFQLAGDEGRNQDLKIILVRTFDRRLRRGGRGLRRGRSGGLSRGGLYR